MPLGSTELQALVDAGEPFAIPRGVTYTLTTPLLIDPGTRIRLDGSMVRGWTAANDAAAYALIRNRDFSTKVDGTHIYGRGTIRSPLGGKVVALYGDDMVFNGVTIDGFSAGQAFVIGGDDIIMRKVRTRNPADEWGVGGIRVTGGARFRAVDCDVVSGDDALQFVPANADTDPFYGLTISNGRFRRCRGVSTATRHAVAMLDSDTVGNITDVAWYRCHGSAANRAIVIENNSAAGTVSNVVLSDIDVTLDDDAVAQAEDIRIHDAETVLLRRVALTNQTSASAMTTTGTSGLTVEASTVDGQALTA